MNDRSNSLTCSASRPLKLRMRADLVAEQQNYLGRRYWVLKDPLALKYYRFEEEEFAILQMLDGKTSLDDIQRRFENQFKPQKISVRELHQLVGMLYRSALVVSDAAGQGEQLLTRDSENRRRKRWASLSNILSVRLKGCDPDRLLTWLDRRLGWFFSLPAFVACLVLAVSAGLLVTVQFDVFQARLPGFHEFFGAGNWFWLAFVLGLTKVVHEFGHGLACKRFGGECHEMGVMFLVLTPCLYCNVSDSWMLPSKWQRAAIGAAGMYVEIVLASLCTFVWWFTHPGMLNYLCLNVMFVSSVSTILFNANPLLRYDGYYILSDLSEIPNLRQKANTILRRKLGSWCLGLPEPEDPFLPQRRQTFFAVYSVAASIYRWVVAISILWFLYHVFEPYGVEILGQLIAAMSLYGLLVHPLWQLGKFFHQPGRMDQVKKPRLLLTMGLSSLMLLLFLFVPLPYHVSCTLHLQPREAASVYVEAAGLLKQINVRPGQVVDTGDTLLELDNVDLTLRIAQLEGQREQLQSQLNSLRHRALSGDDSAITQVDSTAETLAGVKEQLQKRQDDLRRLTITAPRPGVVIPPPTRPDPDEALDTLPTWSGSVFDHRNLNAALDDRVQVCQIADPHKLEAILAIDQSEIEFVRAGQQVEIQLEQDPGRCYVSSIEHISKAEMRYSPSGLSRRSGGDLATNTDSQGREKPSSTTYQASTPLDDETALVIIGGDGQAKIHARRTWRALCQTFHFEL